MNVLAFQIGAERYGMRLGAIRHVLPAAALTRLALAPDYVAGLMDFHGEPVPVIDLSRLAGLASEQVWVDTRIILLDFPAAGGTHLLGVMAEHVTGIERIARDGLADSGVDAAPFLGQVAATAQGLLQLVEPGQLLPPDVQAILFQPKEPAA